MTNIQTTTPELLAALKKAAGKRLSAKQMRLQKISFIMGSLSEDSTITRVFVENQLNKISGADAV